MHLDDELDAALAAEAARSGESKAALLRQAGWAFLAARREAAPGADPWAEFTAGARVAAIDERPDDEVIYG